MLLYNIYLSIVIDFLPLLLINILFLCRVDQKGKLTSMALDAYFFFLFPLMKTCYGKISMKREAINALRLLH
jgi:hypothetical protein